MQPDTLPDKPSDLIELALRDLNAVAANPEYAVDMKEWHKLSPRDNICHVCLAGAVMARTLGFQRERIASWDGLNSTTGKKLRALDFFRSGMIRSGLKRMGITADIPSVDIPEYELDPEGFRNDLQEMANELRGKGY